MKLTFEPGRINVRDGKVTTSDISKIDELLRTYDIKSFCMHDTEMQTNDALWLALLLKDSEKTTDITVHDVKMGGSNVAKEFKHILDIPRITLTFFNNDKGEVNMQHELSMKQKELDKLLKEIADKDKRIEEINKISKELEKRIIAVSLGVSTSDDKIKQMKEKDEKIEKLTKEITTKDEQILTLAKDVISKELEIKTLKKHMIEESNERSRTITIDRENYSNVNIKFV